MRLVRGDVRSKPQDGFQGTQCELLLFGVESVFGPTVVLFTLLTSRAPPSAQMINQGTSCCSCVDLDTYHIEGALGRAECRSWFL